MGVQSEITRLQNAKAAIKAAIEGKGVTVPDGTLLDGMAGLIAAIEAGGGGIEILSSEVTFDTDTRFYDQDVPSGKDVIFAGFFGPTILAADASPLFGLTLFNKDTGVVFYSVGKNGSSTTSGRQQVDVKKLTGYSSFPSSNANIFNAFAQTNCGPFYRPRYNQIRYWYGDAKYYFINAGDTFFFFMGVK